MIVFPKDRFKALIVDFVCGAVGIGGQNFPPPKGHPTG